MSNQEVYLVVPPVFVHLEVFEYLFSQVRSCIDVWLEACKNNLDTPVIVEGVVKSQLNQFFEFTCDRSPKIPIESLVTLGDWVNLRDAYLKVLALDKLPSFAIEEKKEEFMPDILSTGDTYSDRIGDFLASLESTGVELIKTVDFNTLMQVHHRISQHKYWSDPDNRKKAEDAHNLEELSDDVYKLLDQGFPGTFSDSSILPK